MTSEAQIDANRRNAKKSTGPRTSEGKAIASQNAVQHGYSAHRDVIRSESQADYDRHRAKLLDELAPVGAVETVLAERLVSVSWRLMRAGRIENEVIDAMGLEPAFRPLARMVLSQLANAVEKRGGRNAEADDLALGRLVAKDFGNKRVLERLLMHERRLELSLLRTVLQIQQRRWIRQLEGAAEEAVSEARRPESRSNYAKRTQSLPAIMSPNGLIGKPL